MPELPAPRTSAGRSGLAALLAEPAGALLASDYDGTLAPVVDDPGLAVPAPGAVAALQALAGLVGTVAVVTGRPADQAVRLGGLDQVDGLVVLGGYGRQRWQAGATGSASAAEPELPDEAWAAVLDVVRRLGPPEARLEAKGAALAVHLRGCPEPQSAQAALAGPLAEIAEAYGLAVEPGRLVLELRPPGVDKGSALARLAAEHDARSVVFVGDDLGDLAAFRAVEQLRTNGVPGLTIASASVEAPQVADAADLVVDGPPGVVGLLRVLAQVLADGQGTRR